MISFQFVKLMLPRLKTRQEKRRDTEYQNNNTSVDGRQQIPDIVVQL